MSIINFLYNNLYHNMMRSHFISTTCCSSSKGSTEDNKTATAPSTLGAIMADINGFTLTSEEKSRLLNPNIGGVVLFRRNYQSIEQLKALIGSIKALRTPSLLIAVDHEGGRVQRFINEFTRLPAMRTLGKLYDQRGEKIAFECARLTGWVLAVELRSVGVDFSLTPVLDLDWGRSKVIGDRSFHSDPNVVVKLASALISGLNDGGMKGCGKHYPGHGYVAEDSHHTIPQDNRSFTEIEQNDLLIFAKMIEQGLPVIMPAHVIYTSVDQEMPAGYSKVWLQDILRTQLNFKGLVFSDSLTMKGAEGVGNIVERVKTAQQAGCDIFLICNKPEAVDLVLKSAEEINLGDYTAAWEMMRDNRPIELYQVLMNSQEFKKACQIVENLYNEDDLIDHLEIGVG